MWIASSTFTTNATVNIFFENLNIFLFQAIYKLQNQKEKCTFDENMFLQLWFFLITTNKVTFVNLFPVFVNKTSFHH